MFYFNKKLIFDRFLTGNSYFFLISALSLTLIVWIIQAVNFLDFVTEDGHGLVVYFGYTFLNFPKIFTKLMPIMFFISLFYTINKFNEKNELQIFWLNGINKIEFLNALIKYALIFCSLQIILNSFVVPFSQNKARTFIQNSNIDFFPSLIKEKRFIDTVEKLTIYVEKKNSQNEFTNIYLKDDDTTTNTKIISAKRGKLINLNDDRFFELYNGKIMNIDKNKITIFNFKKTNFDLSKYVIGYNKNSYNYELFGICNHTGGVHGGHYTSYVKNANNNWYHFNDTNVNKVNNFNSMKTKQAYCFFYRKKK